MFVPVAIALMMHIRPSAQATQLSCNLDIHYRIYSSGKLVKCVNCRKCGPGLEPDIPCGTIIGKDTSIGLCRPCPRGTFSSNKDTRRCEKCHSESCFAHQVIKGTCTRKSDMSRCIRECNTGYQMNGNQTECVMNKPDNRTTKGPAKSNTTMKDNATKPPTSNISTTPWPTPLNTPSNNPTTTHPSNHPTTPMKSPPTIPSINSPTTPPSSNTPYTSSMKSPSTTPSINPPTTSSSLSTGVIITIIIAVLILIIAIIVVWVWYLRRTQDPRGFRAGLQCAKADTGGEENVRFIKEEERKETGLPSCKMHCTETTGGFESSKPQQAAALLNNNNPNKQIHIPPKQHDALIIANGTNMANGSGIPPASRNRQVVIDMPELSPITMFLGPQQQPQMLVNSSQQSPQTVVFTENHPVLSFNDMPLNIFEKICETFDVCGGTKSWRDVASWLELGLNDVNHIELMDARRRTRKVIETWANKTGNGVKKFESILRNKEMTSLADVIDTWMQSLKGK